MSDEGTAKPGWRYQLGFWMFTIPFAMIIGAPIIVPFLVESATEAAAIIGAIVVIGEIVWFASIPLLGLKGFKELKSKAFGFFALPQGPISPGRTRWGLRLLSLSVLLQEAVLISLLIGYFYLGDDALGQGMFGLTFDQEARLTIGAILASALLLIVAAYTLGVPFFERLGNVFSAQDEIGEGNS